ncbi:MAG: tetratricopeptide repeat protein [Bacteroidia bacterium]|nr:tetratricopeptide repeat protein [Bacteroidia bacterium]
MKDKFELKVFDFAKWCETAAVHYRNGFYADAITNMRKCGETACKIIILFKYSGKAAESRMDQKNYKGLITVIVREDLAERKVINWLETLQIYGNIATHDNIVVQEQARYSITALHLLLNWIYSDLLKTIIPARLKKSFAEIDRVTTTIISDKKVEGEVEKIKKEKTSLEERIALLSGKSEQEKDEIAKLKASLNISEQRIRDLENLHDKLISMEQELAEARLNKVRKEKKDVHAVPKKAPWFLRKSFIASTSIVLIIIIAVFIILTITVFNNVKIKNNFQTTPNVPVTVTDSFMVTVIPFMVLQDNPNMEIKFEEVLVNRIREKAGTLKIPVKAYILNDSERKSVSQQDAISIGEKENSNLVLYGELFETLESKDSIRVNIKYSRITEPPMNGETGIKSFSMLADSSAVIIMQEAGCFVDFAIADFYAAGKRYSDALALCYAITPVTQIQKESKCNIIAYCHYYQKNIIAALKEVENYLALNPKAAYPNFFMGKLLKETGKYKQAEEYYIKSLSIEPDNINTLIEYAVCIVLRDTLNCSKAKKILVEALSYDTTNSVTMFYLASLEKNMRQYKQAALHYEKSLKYDPGDIMIMKELAKIFAFKMDEPEKAVQWLNIALAKDSSDVKVLELLGNIYTVTKLFDPEKAEYYYKKSKENRSDDPASLNFGLGMNAFDKNDYGNAEMYLMKAYSKNSRNVDLCIILGMLYQRLYNVRNELKFFLQAYSLDSMNYLVNRYLGVFYFTEPAYLNMDKAIKHFERVLKTNPYDTLVLARLGTIYYNLKKFKKAKEIYSQLLLSDKNNFFGYKGMGLLAVMDTNYAETIKYLKKANNIYGDDYAVNFYLASAMLRVIPAKNPFEALELTQHAVELAPQNADALLLLAQALIITGKKGEAWEYYKKAIEINPSLKNDIIESSLNR